MFWWVSGPGGCGVLGLRQLAAAASRRFVLIDPQDPDTDRWQPLSGAPADVVARAVEAIAHGSERYYPDMLRYHVGLVAEVLHASGRWPPAFSLPVDACQLQPFPRIVALAQTLGAEHAELIDSCDANVDLVESREGREALRGGLVRLALVMGVAWRPVLTPRLTPAGESVAVGFEHAIRAGDVVLLRTYVDKLKDEATTITPLALADLHAAAGGEWTLLLDEFGSVITWQQTGRSRCSSAAERTTGRCSSSPNPPRTSKRSPSRADCWPR